MNQKKKILVVDDTEVNIEVLLELLSPLYDVMVSISADGILELVNDGKPDLILLDIMMPDIDGYGACKLLKSEETTKDIPVIFITAKVDEESISLAYELGAADYISKPFKPKELLARIAKELKVQELILSLEESQKELELLSSTDHMTKLYNRRYCYSRASEILESSQIYKTAFSLIMIDLDNFKRINDTYGHSVGDDVILSFAQSIKKSSTKNDVLCRWGGEEFLILLPKRDIYKAHMIAENIRHDVEKLKVETASGKVITYTVSIGVAEVNFDEDVNIEEVIMNADKALYKAKSRGRNTVCDEIKDNSL